MDNNECKNVELPTSKWQNKEMDVCKNSKVKIPSHPKQLIAKNIFIHVLSLNQDLI